MDIMNEDSTIRLVRYRNWLPGKELDASFLETKSDWMGL